MKSVNILKIAFCFTLIIFVVLFSVAAVFAVDADGDGYDDETGEYVGGDEPVYTEYVPDETDPEPIYTEPQTYYTEPEPYTEPPTDPVITEAPTQATATEYNQGIVEPEQNTTEEFVPPTVPKTISTKKYETNYFAGIVSWICVGVGVIVVAIVMISTKVSGRKNNALR